MISREVRGGRGARGPAGGAVGRSDGGEERRAGSGPWQRDPGGPGALVRTEPLESSTLEDKLFERERYVTPDHKTSHKGPFLFMYTSYES